MKLQQRRIDGTMGFLRMTWRMLWLCGLLGVSSALLAAPGVTILTDQADFSSAQYREDVVDLEVKVLGGLIRHQRHLDEGWNWQFNPAWSDLELVYALDADPAVDAPSEIRRHRVSYSRRGKSSAYVFDDRQQIVRTENGFRWEDRRGNAIDYDLAGRIVSYNDRNEVYVRFTRDEEERLATVEDHHRNTILTFYYYPDGRLERVVDYTGREVRYTYDLENGLLAEVHDVLGGVWRYGYRHYSDIGYLLNQRTDPEENVREIDYAIGGGMACVQVVGGRWSPSAASGSGDSAGGGGAASWSYTGAACLSYRSQPRFAQLQRVRDAEGTVTSYHFHYDEDAKTYTTGAVDGAGGLRTRTFNERGEVVEEGRDGQATIRREEDGRIRTLTDARGYKTTVELDEWRNVIKETYADGSSIRKRWDPRFTNLLEEVDENGVVTRHDYDSRGNRIRTTEAFGRPEQRVTEYDYDAYGNNIAFRVLADAYSPQAEITFTYDEFGNVTSYTDPEHHVTHYLRHDALGNVLEQRDARGNLWQYDYDAAGNLLREETPLGSETRYDYNKVGNLIGFTDATQKSTTLKYDGRNRLIRVTDSLQASTHLSYDGADRLTSVTDALNNTRRMIYDRAGRLEATLDALGNRTENVHGAGDLLEMINYPTYRQRFEHDARGRTILAEDQADDAAPRRTGFEYDSAGNVIRVSDANQRVTEYRYDGHRRNTRIVDAAQQLTQMSYDSRDNLVEVVNPRQIAIRRYRYDGNDRMVEEYLPDDSLLEYRYDPNGNLVMIIDAKGQVAWLDYDADNRLERVRYFDDAASGEAEADAARTITFSYDRAGHLTGYNDGTTQAVYTYDGAGRLLTTSVDYGGGVTLDSSYTYYLNGLKESFTGSDGITYSYRYNANGDLTQVQIPGEGTYIVNEYQWLAPTQITLPGGGRRNVAYNGFQQVRVIEGLDPAHNPVQQDGYEYDPMGNIRTWNTLHGAYAYNYDELDRLIEWQGPESGNTYDYDPVANRLHEARFVDELGDPYPWEYDESDRLRRRGPIRYEYDANGNLVLEHNGETGERRRFVWSHDNRLTEIRDGTGALVASYAYDPFGRRVKKVVGGITTLFLYSEEGLVAEADASGNVTATYGYEPDSMWGTQPLFIRQGDRFGYYHTDHLGTPHLVTASNGEVLWKGQYDAFGRVEVEVEEMRNPLRFSGQYYDPESTLHFNWHRYYDPSIGRYIVSDPIGLAGGLNSFVYAEANPLAMIDPFGLKARPVPWCSWRDRLLGICDTYDDDDDLIEKWVEKEVTDWCNTPCDKFRDSCIRFVMMYTRSTGPVETCYRLHDQCVSAQREQCVDRLACGGSLGGFG